MSGPDSWRTLRGYFLGTHWQIVARERTVLPWSISLDSHLVTRDGSELWFQRAAAALLFDVVLRVLRLERHTDYCTNQRILRPGSAEASVSFALSSPPEIQGSPLRVDFVTSNRHICCRPLPFFLFQQPPHVWRFHQRWFECFLFSLFLSSLRGSRGGKVYVAILSGSCGSILQARGSLSKGRHLWIFSLPSQ